MIDLLVSVRPVDRLTDYPGIADLRELVATPAVRANTRLWLDDEDRTVAFALVDSYNNLHWELDPRGAAQGLESELVAWGEVCVRRAIADDGLPRTLDAACREDDTERIALLEREGFLRQPIRSLRMARSLAEPIPLPHLPPGFRIRPVAGEHEAEPLVELHRTAFGTHSMTVEERLAMMRVPEYDPELDLVAVAPEGRLVAYCLCSICREEIERTGRSEGSTDPIATHPDHRRRGLAKALLLTGLTRLKSRGIETAVLGTSSENAAMQRTAQAVGFHTRSTRLWFAKPVASPRHATDAGSVGSEDMDQAPAP